MDIHIIYSTVCNIVTIISTLTVYKMHTIRNKKITIKKHTIGVWVDSFYDKLKQYDAVL